MKTRLNMVSLFPNVLVIVLIMAAGTIAPAQESKLDHLEDFKVTVEKTEDGIALKGIDGTAWTDLAFSIDYDQPQAIDEYGMTELENTNPKKGPDLADFLFTITKTKDGFALKGIEGTAWVDLSFSLGENTKQAIDQWGMTYLK